MRIFIRVDSGAVIGDGHLFRCKALAFQFQQSGVLPIFVTRPGEGFHPDKFKPFERIELNQKILTLDANSSYLEWLGVDEKTDAEECLAKTHSTKNDLWLVDHYGISGHWENILIQKHNFIVSVDDIFREHASQVLIDHNFTADVKLYEQKSLNPLCHYLLTPQYALLRKDICESEDYQPNNQDSYLLFLGAVSKELFNNFLEVLRELNLSRLVILNPPCSIEPRANEKILDFCGDMPGLYREQKLVFGTCGVANMERMASGIPTISCSVVDNQKLVGDKIKALGIAWHLGDLRDLNSEQIKDQIQPVLKNPDLLNEIILKAKVSVSKNGISKIVNEVLTTFTKWQSR